MAIHEKYIKCIYKPWSTIYDKIIDSLFKFDRAKVIKSLSIKPKEQILEIGVGTGLNLPYYSNCSVTGIDFSKDMIAKAKEKKSTATIRLQMADARKLPFEKNQFDKALTTYVLRVSPEPKKILQETSRVVKKNGLFAIVDQFKGKNRILLAIAQPLKLLLGWGKEHDIHELISGTPWVIVQNKQFGKMSNTRLVVLRNKKK